VDVEVDSIGVVQASLSEIYSQMKRIWETIDLLAS
jgi:hypothetical protein